MSLKGKIILNTRPASASGEFSRLLQSFGAAVLNFPTVEIHPEAVSPELDAKLKKLDDYDGLIFTSANAVRSFFQIIEAKGMKYRGKILCVGEKTSEAAKKYGYHAVMFSSSSGAEGLIENLTCGKYRNKRFLYLRGNLILNDIKGAVRNVDEATVYWNTKPAEPENLSAIKQLIHSKKIDCIAFFSPSAVRNFLEFFPEFSQDGIHIASIGKTTKSFAESSGLRVDIVPKVHTSESLCDAISEFYNSPPVAFDLRTNKELAKSSPIPASKGETATSLFLRACFNQPTPRTPIWFMRQAGRYLPEYRAIRDKYHFLTMCQTPELASEITLQPIRRFGFDAAIIFSDILVVPQAMGLNLNIVESRGPMFDKPMESINDINRLQTEGLIERLDYVFKAVSITREHLNGVPLIGFSGSPWTLAVYMLEGGSSKDFSRAKSFIHNHPSETHILLQKLSDTVIEYLENKIRAGCDAVQIFDTWGGILDTGQYEEFSMRYVNYVAAGLQPAFRVPVIVFTKGIKAAEKLNEINCDVISVDWTLNLACARIQACGKALQGNLNPEVLLSDPETVKHEAKKVLDSYGWGHGHIFNLGHGILPSTPVENVKVLVDFVKEESRKYHDEVNS